MEESFSFQRKGWWLGKLLPLEWGTAKLKDLAVSLTPFITNTPDRAATLLTQSTSTSAISTNLCSWPTCTGSCRLIRHQPLSIRCGFERFSPLEVTFCVMWAAEASPRWVREGNERRQVALPAQILPTQPLAPAPSHFPAPNRAVTPTSKGHTQCPTWKPRSREAPTVWYSHCAFQLFALSF